MPIEIGFSASNLASIYGLPVPDKQTSNADDADAFEEDFQEPCKLQETFDHGQYLPRPHESVPYDSNSGACVQAQQHRQAGTMDGLDIWPDAMQKPPYELKKPGTRAVEKWRAAEAARIRRENFMAGSQKAKAEPGASAARQVTGGEVPRNLNEQLAGLTSSMKQVLCHLQGQEFVVAAVPINRQSHAHPSAYDACWDEQHTWSIPPWKNSAATPPRNIAPRSWLQDLPVPPSPPVPPGLQTQKDCNQDWPTVQEGYCMHDGGSLSRCLRDLSSIDSGRVVVVRKINKLGLKAAKILRKHFAQDGRVDFVFAPHSRNSDATTGIYRMRPGKLGFVVMRSAEEAEAIFSRGVEQCIYLTHGDGRQMSGLQLSGQMPVIIQASRFSNHADYREADVGQCQ